MPDANSNKNEEINIFPGLWVVATPIGNLDDISLRAQKALKFADKILCEDTRRTKKLLSSLGINKNPERFDKNVEGNKISSNIKFLLSGKSVALVSDAGTPCISDPGARLVAAALEASIAVTPVPGPSAITSLISCSGFGESGFNFLGFFPRQKKEKDAHVGLVTKSANIQNVFVWFESPERILETVRFIGDNFLNTVELVVAKELTKVFERIYKGTPQEVLDRLGEEDNLVKGEFCVAIRVMQIERKQEKEEINKDTLSMDIPWVKALHALLDCGVSVAAASKSVSQYFGVKKKNVYELALYKQGKK